MAISKYAASVFLPKVPDPYPSLLSFLSARFPKIDRACWEGRLAEGKVLDEDGRPLTPDSAYLPGKRIFYYREVAKERVIPFAERILFQNEELLVACKPHFLPMTPGGPFVEECLLHRLRKATGNHDLVPVHRLDRDTAGVVLFSASRRSRDVYSQLFRAGRVEKSYEAVSAAAADPDKAEWLVENRMAKGEPWFRMRTVPGAVNARSWIRRLDTRDGRSRFILKPLTGKTHQLRLHLSLSGFGILNDRYYPELLPERPDDFENPLQLLARSISFQDPFTGKEMEFRSDRQLNSWA